MNRDDVIRMAVQCQLVTTANREGIFMDALDQFAKLVAAKEREECANVCEQQEEYGPLCETIWDCAAAIRARGEA